MKFYIVTPTFNSLAWLQNCIRSVADQCAEGVQVHHHIQDGGSTDGTVAWLEQWKQQNVESGDIGYEFSYISGKDAGMYDAINRAWDAAPADADVIAHINSDEQYLPEALAALAKKFTEHPDAEVALGSYIIIDAEQRYICHRRPVQPSARRSATVCEIITCSCFYRADYFKSLGLRFDTRLRALADLVFYIELTGARARFLVLPELITSSFTVTGNNLAWSEVSQREWDSHMASLPFYKSKMHGINFRWVNLKRLLTDKLQQQPREYSIYRDNSEQRVRFSIKRPTCHWGCRTEGERD